MAALPGSFPMQCARPCRQEQPQGSLGFYHHRLCSARSRRGKTRRQGDPLVADEMRFKLLKLAMLVGAAEEDVLSYLTFPAQHCAKLNSTKPIELLNGEIKRRTYVVVIFLNKPSIWILVGAVLMEQTEECTVQRGRYMTLPSWGPCRQSGICTAKQPQLPGWLRNARRGRRGDIRYRSAARADSRVGPGQNHVLLLQRHRLHSQSHTGVMLPSVVGALAAYMMSVRSVPGRPSGKRARMERPAAASYPASPGTASRWGLLRGGADPARS